MSAPYRAVPESRLSPAVQPNGSGAAAVLAASIGSLALAVIAIAADRISGFAKAMIFYAPTGPLSGVTTSAIAVWLAVWAVRSVPTRVFPIS